MSEWYEKLTWYYSNDYGSLTQEQRYQNASNIYYYFKIQWDWRMESIAAMVGNMEAESWLSPSQWQGGRPYSGGLGLVQWTPYTLLTDWAQENGYDPFNGLTQLRRLIYEYQNGLEYYASQLFPYQPRTWQQFAHLEYDSQGDFITVDRLAEAFLFNYLRPADPQSTLGNRKRAAQKYYEYFQTLPARPPGLFPYWLLFKMKERRDRTR